MITKEIFDSSQSLSNSKQGYSTSHKTLSMIGQVLAKPFSHFPRVSRTLQKISKPAAQSTVIIPPVDLEMEDCSRNFSQMRRSLILCLEYEAHLKLTEREANQLQASIKRMMEILTNIIEIRSELATSRQSRLVKSKKIQEFSDSQASSFLDTLEYSWELLETFDHTATNNLVMMLRLSDVFLSFLIALEKYELISSRCLSDLLNRRNEGQVILNYIIGKFPWRKEEGMSVYLNLHMRQTVQASRLTRDVQPLLKHLTESSWTRIDYTYLLYLFARNSPNTWKAL